MKKILSFILVLTMVLCLSACGGGETGNEKPVNRTDYDKGMAAIDRLDYETAVKHFNIYIQAYPNNTDGYLGLIQAHNMFEGDLEAVTEVIDRMPEKDRYIEILHEGSITYIKEYNDEGRLFTQQSYDDSGVKDYYRIYNYTDEGVLDFCNFYRGGCIDHCEKYDENGNLSALSFFTYNFDTQKIIMYGYEEFDSNGNITIDNYYNMETGRLEEYYIYEYPAENHIIKSHYDRNKNLTASEERFPDGSMKRSFYNPQTGDLRYYTEYPDGTTDSAQSYNPDGTPYKDDLKQ